MNGKMIGRKPLYVAVAQRKEERKARLQVIFITACFSGQTSPSFFPDFEARPLHLFCLLEHKD